MSGTRTSKRDGRLVSVEFVTEEGPRQFWIDERARSRWSRVEREFPGQIVEIVSSDAFDRRMIIRSESDVDPPKYHLYGRSQRPYRRIGRHAARARRGCARADASCRVRGTGWDADPRVRDPPHRARPGRRPRSSWFMGAPGRRDVWGWDAEAQFFASRGYTVFQMNFRGSTGYGREHAEAGNKQFGLAMQDDLTDGTKWLIEGGARGSRSNRNLRRELRRVRLLAGVRQNAGLVSCGRQFRRRNRPADAPERRRGVSCSSTRRTTN